jgi:hypothetical protein
MMKVRTVIILSNKKDWNQHLFSACFNFISELYEIYIRICHCLYGEDRGTNKKVFGPFLKC